MAEAQKASAGARVGVKRVNICYYCSSWGRSPTAKSPLWGSNPRPYAYGAHALPAELRRLLGGLRAHQRELGHSAGPFWRPIGPTGPSQRPSTGKLMLFQGGLGAGILAQAVLCSRSGNYQSVFHTGRLQACISASHCPSVRLARLSRASRKNCPTGLIAQLVRAYGQ